MAALLVNSGKTNVSAAMKKNRFRAIVAQWPVAIVVFGIVLTLIWISGLVWFPIRLLNNL